MPTLSQHDWRRLHEVVLTLHAAPDLGTAAADLLVGLRGFFPFDIGNVQDDRGGVRRIPWKRGGRTTWEASAEAARADGEPPRGQRVMPTWGPDFLPLREAFFAVSAERHPHTEYFRRTGDGSARRLSEIVSPGALRRTAFFNEISRPLAVAHQVTIYASLPSGGTLTLAAARGGRTDFSERDRLVLELLRPHLALVWQKAVRLEEQAAQRLRLRSYPPAAVDIADRRQALRPLGLTPREAEVLVWVGEGKTNAEIGLILAVSAGTVKTHVERILAKLGCETRTAAARTALEFLR